MVMGGGGMIAKVIDDGIVKLNFWVWSFSLNKENYDIITWKISHLNCKYF